MRVLLTGGAGFIGSHIADSYIGSGHQVVIVDDLSSGRRKNVNPKAVFIKANLVNRRAIELIFQKYGPFNLINHHAAQKSVDASVQDPIGDAKRNILASLQLFELARRYRVRKIIFASTGGALYGDQVELPTPEEARIKPVSPYGIAKYAVENYLRFYRESVGIVTQILRYANVYGPRQDLSGEAGVVAIFCQQSRRGRDLTIFGDGEQTRDFIYVDDVVAANLAMLDFPHSGIWNIGTGQETTINNLASQLMNLGGLKINLVRHQARPGEVKRSCLLTQKARRDFNWVSRTPLDQGLKKTLASMA